MHNMLHTFDNRLTTWVQSWPAWLYQPMVMITNIGQPVTVIVCASALLIWSLLKHHDRLAISSAIILGTIIVASMLKVALRRTRPETEYVANMMFQSFSFPSGHAAAATVGFGFLAYAATMVLPQPWNSALCVAAVAFGVLVCLSRIYLGAHYPSDVLGGMLIGLIGLGVIVFVVRPFA